MRDALFTMISAAYQEVTTEFKTSLKKKKLSTWMLLYCHKIVYVLCNMYTVWYPGKNQHPLFLFSSSVWEMWLSIIQRCGIFQFVFLFTLVFRFRHQFSAFWSDLLQPTELWKRTKRMVNPTHKNMKNICYRAYTPWPQL